MAYPALHLILIEDDEVDVEAVRRLIAQEHLPCRLTHFIDGHDAQQALLGDFGERLLAAPYLILLDLNLPRLNGHEFLAWLRQKRRFASAIVFVLTTSEMRPDVARAYEHQVAGYLIKQRLGTSLASLGDLLKAYITANTFPG